MTLPKLLDQTRERPAPREAYFVRSLDRGLAVIRVFGADRPALTLSEVARSAGLTRAAARRFLLTLADLGYVRLDGKLFSLTPRVLELGYSYLSGLGLPQVSLPHLEELSRRVDESAGVAVLDGADIVYVARVPPTPRITGVAIEVGTRLPAHATSAGRVLLAGLPEPELRGVLAAAATRAAAAQAAGPTEPAAAPALADSDALRAELATVAGQGWAMVDRELGEGLRAVAAPITDRAGRVVAAVGVSVHAGRRTAGWVGAQVLPELLSTAARITADLVAGSSGTASPPPAYR